MFSLEGGVFTLFEVLAGGAFDLLNRQHNGEFDQNCSKSQMPGGLPGGWAVLELTGTLLLTLSDCAFVIREFKKLGRDAEGNVN